MNVQIKSKLVKRVYKLSEETRKDTSFHLNKALEIYLDETDDLKTAAKRMKNGKDKVITSAELRKSLGL